ncbi:TonB-dependent receptor [Microbulbifer variabilis]|uniref:TonB-dependent receptor n=1 Tax=Microbulbifer variabilis TaxID=266805 RepID=A0ABY4VE51_9GAMM|nr:TonB-dependent receptor [Microbulbifer variabilis]USD22407.1 TonB-dependent receptor [Microbulbifer variabilis]
MREKIESWDAMKIMKNNSRKRVNTWSRGFRQKSMVTAISLVVSSMAIAEDTSDSDERIEEVQVIGILESATKNLEIKRDSLAVVDAITAEDIGKFPDKNVADSLQRVPGVTIDRSGGEGSTVSIRGTSSEWTLTQLNGNYIATSGSGAPSRNFNYLLLPSSMISKAEVYKSPEARIDEGGVGGTVILHSHKPLDLDAGQGVITTEATYSDTTEEWDPQYNAFYSWKNESETFGILVGYTSQDRGVTGVTNYASGWRLHSDTDENADLSALVDQTTEEVFNNVWAPTQVSIHNSKEDRTRDGYQLAAQWRPTERLEFGFAYFGSKLGYDTNTQSLTFAEWNDHDDAYYGIEVDGDTVVTYGFNDNGDLNENNWGDGDVNGGVDVYRGLMSPQLTGYTRKGESESNTYDFEVIYEGDFYTAAINVGHTEAEGGTSELTYANMDARYGSVDSWLWSIADGKPSYEVSTDLTKDTEAYPYYDWFGSDATENSDEESYYQLDLAFDTNWGIVNKFYVGTKYRDHEARSYRDIYRWDDETDDNGGYRGWLPGDQWFHNPDYHPDTSTLISDKVVDNSAGNTGAIDYLAFDTDALMDYVRGNFNLTVMPVLSGTYTIDEEIFSTYAQADFIWRDFRGNLGVRYVSTKLSTETYDDITGMESDEVIANSRSNTTKEFLPSLNVAWDLTDDLVIRFTASKAMSRVSYAYLGQAETYGPPVHIISPDEWTGRGSGFFANTDLEAMISKQFDLGLEWYYADGSALGVTLFDKDIDNLPIQVTEIVEREHDCCNGPIEVEMKGQIGGGNATSRGVELFAQHAFESGFGLMANYTFTDTGTSTIILANESIEAEIPGTARHQYNLSAFYENENFGVRASYNWVDDRVTSLHRGYAVYDKDYGQLDLNATYTFTDNFNISASIINLTEEVAEGYWKQENRMTYNNYSGRRFYIGANYKF